MYREFLKGILSRKEIELLERDKYYREEYSKDYYDEWYKGNDLVDEIYSEGKLLDDTYCIKRFKNEE
jgi:hypothetical protein